MSRDFIYRIWGIKEKKYVMTASLYEDAELMPLNEYFKRENYIIQEYTGLKDVNLNRIFEGDILEFTARYKQKGNVPVVYYGGSYGCIITDDSDFKEFWNLSHIVQQYYPKIIGTIHDNNFII
jgi:hypothetical protein